MWEALISPVAAIINKLIPDKAAAAAATAKLQEMTTQGELQEEMAQLISVTSAQSDVDKVEAASTNWFVAGWRPYVGWVCGTGLAMSAVVGPFVTWASAVAGHPVTFPAITDPVLRTTLAGMLGLGHISRTIEKINNVSGKH